MHSNGQPLKTLSIMNKKEIAKEFTRQILDPNTHSINFELVTNMLNEIQQTHKDVLSNMDSYRIRNRLIDSTLSAHRSQLESINMQISHLNRNLEESSKLFQKSKKVSLWHRYSTVIIVGVISALLTNLLVMMIA